MKTHAILAAVLLTVPSASFAGHWGYGGSNHCSPRHYWGGGYGFGWYAPLPPVSFTYVGGPRIYRAGRYYAPSDSALGTDVQRALKRRGYYDGSIDGDIGPRSRAAIRQYQNDHRLAVTGRIDEPLLRSLGF